MIQSFSSRTELTEWLINHHINLSQWGQGEAKTVADLWTELQQGEAVLHGPPPRRVVRVAVMIFQRGDKVLLEGQQQIGPDKFRHRDQLPAEKILPHETPLAAAWRGVAEELGLTPTQTQVLQVEASPHRQQKISPSYPDLPTEYWFYRVYFQAAELPDQPFWTTETTPSPAHFAKRHEWYWGARPLSLG